MTRRCSVPRWVLEYRYYHRTSLYLILQERPLAHPLPSFIHIVRVPTFYSKPREVVDEITDVRLDFFAHVLTRAAKTMYLPDGTIHNYIAQTKGDGGGSEC